MKTVRLIAATAHAYASLAVLAIILTSKDSELWNAAMPITCAWLLMTLDSLSRFSLLISPTLPALLVRR